MLAPITTAPPLVDFICLSSLVALVLLSTAPRPSADHRRPLEQAAAAATRRACGIKILTSPKAALILRYMAKCRELDQMFHALADSTRRAMVERLSGGPASMSE